MATPNPDSATTGIPVTVRFSNTGGCIPPAMVELLQNAEFRIDLPAAQSGQEALGVSSLSDNIARLDSQGKFYVPGFQFLTVPQQTVVMGTTIAPGTPVDLTFNISQVADPDTAFLGDLRPTYEPANAPVNMQGPFVNSGTVRYTFYRQATADTPPYDEIVIRMGGKILVAPSPSPA